MRVSLVFCVAVVFHTIFVASRGNEDHEVQNSTTTRDVECKADCRKLLLDRILMMSFSSDEENDHKLERRVHPSRVKRRTMNRPRTRLRARNSTRIDKGAERQVDRLPPIARVSNETDLYDNKHESTDVALRNHTDKNADDVQIHVRKSFRNSSFKQLSFNNYRHGGLESLLARLVVALENNSREDDPKTPTSSAIKNKNGFDDEDRCQKWLDNWEKIEKAFPGSVVNLPACPCLYPNSIFYDNQIWDSKRKKKFRWRDVSHDKDRLAIYKSGAAYCVQTLSSQENESAVVQHCCYDGKRKLLTRGSGAGTPYIVSPDISPLLHDKIDLLPWRLCKGDFTRYNGVRTPNNDNNCETNPDNKEYQHQVQRAKNY